VQSPLAPIRVVRVNDATRDPALNMTPAQILRYLEDRDPAKLAFKDGCAPDWIEVQPIPRTQIPLLDSLFEDEQRWVRAFAIACHRIVCGDGSVIECPPEQLAPSGKDAKMAGEEWVYGEVFDRIGMHGIYEVGQLALARCKLPRGAAGPLPRPPS
jgi:hypothetical protein